MIDRHIVGAGLLALLLGGCTVGPDFHPPVADLPARWQGSVQASAPPNQDWWRGFGDPVLDRLEAQALAANLDLHIAEERLVAARIARDARHADSLPQVGGQLGYSRNRIGTAGLAGVLAPLLGQSPEAADAAIPKAYAFDLYQSDISMSWAIDLWGKNRRETEAATAGIAQAEAAMRGARLSVEAAVAQTYWQWRGLVEERRLALRDQALGQRTLAIAAALQARGLATGIDVRAVEQEQRARQDALLMLDADIANAARALAVLVGGNPDAPPIEAAERPAMPLLAEPAPGLPSDLARRRPDILAAEAALHAATAAIGAGQADFYPSLNLSGLFGIDVLNLADFGWDARTTSAGPVLSIPIFAGGRLQRQLSLRRSEERSAALAYQKTVRDAWREVDDALTNIRALDRRRALAKAGSLARMQTVTAIDARYRRGDIAATPLIEAQAAQVAAERALLRQTIAGALARIQLYVALGG
ncbi:efflux transporter outer membrane subunit [Sphingomonas sp. gentR]|jgi:NodT family efflux transporter outer membrane factor (OMF) lipoprotein|uniref:efflux transporter outer membrane subunit n=1 Tax=unclassified Sphingomonas TaxID=196159 RepID=UPI0009728CC8|nr:efflux transporter outer membrane subunit [Sphingomonas sp. LK11]APX65771.1 secretion system type I outer membrane efflux pump lipoprotein NodT [Sphingomonas sp. LK11]